MNNISIVLGLLISLVVVSCVSSNDYEDAKVQHKNYCENVDNFIDSNGVNGHPDYDGIYYKTCFENEDKS